MMKMRHYSKRRAFSIAELLISMLIVCVVAAALVPMIGPKKTKSPRQRFSSGSYACFWKPVKNDEGVITSYELHEIINGKDTKIADPNQQFCTFKPPRANRFNFIVIGASGNGFGYGQDDPDVWWSEGENGQKGDKRNFHLPLNNFQNALLSAPDIIKHLVNKVFNDDNRGNLRAEIEIESANGGQGFPCGEETNYQVASGCTFVGQAGCPEPNPNKMESQGAYAGKNVKMTLVVYVTPNTQVSINKSDAYNGDVNISVTKNGSTEKYSVSAAGKGEDARPVHPVTHCNIVNTEEFAELIQHKPYTLGNGYNFIIDRLYDPNNKLSIATINSSSTGVPVYDYHDYKYYKEVNDLIGFNYPKDKLQNGSDAEAKLGTSKITGTSGRVNCNGNDCETYYSVTTDSDEEQKSITDAKIATVNILNTDGGFPCEYYDKYVKIKAYLGGDSAASITKMVPEINKTLKITPARNNTENSSVKLIKSDGTEAEIINSKSAPSAGSYAIEHPFGSYQQEWGPYPENWFKQNRVIPQEVSAVPKEIADQLGGYVPGRGGSGAYPWIHSLEHKPYAIIKDYSGGERNRFQDNLSITEGGYSFTIDPNTGTCADGSRPVKHKSGPHQDQYYCRATQGSPGIVVITW